MCERDKCCMKGEVIKTRMKELIEITIQVWGSTFFRIGFIYLPGA